MEFSLTILTDPEGVRKMFACWDQQNAYFVQSKLGNFKFYQFIRTVFSDFSESFRTGTIDFSNSGDGKVCVTWQLNGNYSEASCSQAIQNGIDQVNDFAAQYQQLFNSDVRMGSVDKNQCNGSYTVELTFQETPVEVFV